MTGKHMHQIPDWTQTVDVGTLKRGLVFSCTS